MDFFSIILFLGLYYIRPHEWISITDIFRLNYIAIGTAIWSLLFSRNHGTLKKTIFMTPHDTFMALYFFWFLWTAPSAVHVFGTTYTLFVFYWVTVLTLKDIPRLVKFLHWWTFFIIFIAALAVASEFGFDPTDSYSLTHGRMKERLTLNLGIFNNPNALGHSIVPAVVMLYFLSFWGRPLFSRLLTPIAMAIPIYCIYLTSSKGAFLTGFATVVSGLSFKRPIAIQAAIFLLAGTMGWTAMQYLPRMQEIGSAKTDQAIQGRVQVFTFGLEILETRLCGVGYARFGTELERRYHFFRSAHSSYVYIGAEFGKPGLYLFLGILYFSFRTLMTIKTTTDDEERARRALFVLLISYTISSWMIGWYNRATFWLMVGGCAALHRIMLAKEQDQLAAAAAQNPPAEVAASPRPALAYGSPPTATATINPNVAVNDIKLPPGGEPATPTSDATPPVEIHKPLWTRVRWYDLVAIYLLLLITIEFWRYAIKKM